jgi:hypothetical protein
LSHWLAGMLLRLWRELHRHDPVQLHLEFSGAASAAGVVGAAGPPSRSAWRRRSVREATAGMLF